MVKKRCNGRECEPIYDKKYICIGKPGNSDFHDGVENDLMMCLKPFGEHPIPIKCNRTDLWYLHKHLEGYLSQDKEFSMKFGTCNGCNKPDVRIRKVEPLGDFCEDCWGDLEQQTPLETPEEEGEE